MGTNPKSKHKLIPVWVGASEKAIVLNRADGETWEYPVFVNAPNGIREAIMVALGKTVKEDGTTTNAFTLRWELNESMITKDMGENGVVSKGFVKFTTLEEAEEWLNALVHRPKGFVQPEIQSAANKWLAKLDLTGEKKDEDLEDF